jgi:hypothetical protein
MVRLRSSPKGGILTLSIFFHIYISVSRKRLDFTIPLKGKCEKFDARRDVNSRLEKLLQ